MPALALQQAAAKQQAAAAQRAALRRLFQPPLQAKQAQAPKKEKQAQARVLALAPRLPTAQQRAQLFQACPMKLRCQRATLQ